ncbi:D-arabinitol 2-dehydrogenase [ribulose-forming] [[Candida] railenensis]|uniref:D-arabinitol 2-dehydrogenase [ribulose-forming] n=1 Tax=[Candida] railenensis TaxID=45579 RepID=A0A9P0QKF3_9ASCO|nr:D-arabinitol 2-dehydrogenase [ribulose-forming] [[Candida] railenensis]
MSVSMFDIKSKVALVTGANRGIGLAIAEAYVESSCHVIMIHRPETDPSEAVSRLEGKRRQGEHTEIITLPFNLNSVSQESVEKLTSLALDKSPTKRIDILVNNAAVAKAILAQDLSMKDYDEIMTVNLKAPLLFSKVVGKHMIDRYENHDDSYRGKIINISSIMAYTAMTHSTAYTVAKSGLHNLTKSLSNEWSLKGINVNVIAPGPTDTDMIKRIQRERRSNGEETSSNTTIASSKIPFGRKADPEDYKGTIIYLSSRASDYVCGSVVVVDGGYMG